MISLNRACYEKVGFYRIESYFTSTQELRSDMYYTFSFLGAKTYYTRKTYGRFIACVKE